VHISDISWTQKIKHPSELYKKGQEVRAVVLSIDKENERFSLGIKQLEKDPWEGVNERFQRGQHVTGTITNVTSFGIFLELGEGIEGLVHVSELGDIKVQNVKSGEQLSAVVTNIDRKGRKMSLSIKELKDMAEKEDVAAFIESQGKGDSSLAEQLKQQWESAAPPGDAAETEGHDPVQADAAPDAGDATAEKAGVTPDTEPDKES
jgi:small subunit ribosomal protein S1